MRILVTGATGNVGRPLCERLARSGHEVRGLTRDPSRAGLPEGVEAVAGNLADLTGLREALEGVEAVHFISFDGQTYEPLSRGDEIVRLAVEAGVGRATVLAGGVEKSPLEEALLAGEMAWTRLMPVEFMSNAWEWADSIKRDGVVREGFPEAKSALVHEADIADVAAVALTEDGHEGKEYWITGPQALTAPEQVEIISDVIGTEVRFAAQSNDEMVARWKEEGYSSDDIEFFLQMRTDPPAEGYTVQPTVEQVTGRSARTFRDWVQENAAAFSA